MPSIANAKVIEFSSFGILPFMAAGLVDSINPCAIVVLVFFIWLTFYFCRKYQDVLVVGIVFIAGVFITLSLLEFGVFENFRSLELYYLLVKVLYLFIGTLVILLGILNLRDWWISLYQDDQKKSFSRLPILLRGENGESEGDRAGAATKSLLLKLVVAALFSAFIFALLSSACRGQPNLTMMAYVAGVQNQRINVLLYVLTYNFLTVIPLVGTFLLILFSVQSGGLAKFYQQHFSKAKVAQAGVLLGLGFGLLFMFRA